MQLVVQLLARHAELLRRLLQLHAAVEDEVLHTGVDPQQPEEDRLLRWGHPRGEEGERRRGAGQPPQEREQQPLLVAVRHHGTIAAATQGRDDDLPRRDTQTTGDEAHQASGLCREVVAVDDFGVEGLGNRDIVLSRALARLGPL